MKINRNSWHYRFMDWVLTSRLVWLSDDKTGMDTREWRLNNLCRYFWYFVFCFSWVLVHIPITLIVAPFIGATVLLVGVIELFLEIGNLFPLRAEKKNKKPNLFLSFLKAKKQKVCPIIEYTDSE